MARAAAFVRYKGADGTGHLAWAFDLDLGETNCGAVEDADGDPSCDPAEMGFWDTTSPNPVEVMAQHAPTYDALKYVDLEVGNVADAQSTVEWVKAQPYCLFGRNCMDDVYDVLRSYGVPNLPPPVLHWFPNNWFATFTGTLESMTFEWRFPGANPLMSLESPAVTPRGIKGVAPKWRVPGSPEWHDLQAQIAEQSGIPSTRARANRYRTRQPSHKSGE